MPRLSKVAKNLLFAVSLAGNAYSIYAFHQIKEFGTSSSIRYAVNVAKSGSQLYHSINRFLKDPQFNRELDQFNNCWQEYQNHKPEVERDIKRLEERLELFSGKSHQPVKDTPSRE